MTIGDIGALIIRIGFRGILYCDINKKPPNSIGVYEGPYIILKLCRSAGAATLWVARWRRSRERRKAAAMAQAVQGHGIL